MGCSEERIVELYETYYQALYHFCLVYIHRDPRYLPHVEDCIQDAFLYALRNRKRYANEKHVLNTMMKYCRTYFKDLNRKERRRAAITGRHVSLDETIDLCDPVYAIARWCETQDDHDFLEEFRQSMTDKEQDVFEAYFEKDMDKKETALHLGITEDAVKGTVQRIRKKANLKKEWIIGLIIAFLFPFTRP